MMFLFPSRMLGYFPRTLCLSCVKTEADKGINERHGLSAEGVPALKKGGRGVIVF